MASDRHDIVHKNNITKAPSTAARPHADGCVGCRREAVCIRCGKDATLDTGRCLSGACPKCCPVIHKHVDNDPTKVASAR